MRHRVRVGARGPVWSLVSALRRAFIIVIDLGIIFTIRQGQGVSRGQADSRRHLQPGVRAGGASVALPPWASLRATFARVTARPPSSRHSHPVWGMVITHRRPRCLFRRRRLFACRSGHSRQVPLVEEATGFGDGRISG